jgi:hypothetical protein
LVVLVCLISLSLAGPAQATTVGSASVDATGPEVTTGDREVDQLQSDERVRDHEQNDTRERPPELEVSATVENRPGETVRVQLQVVVPANVTDFGVEVPSYLEVVKTRNLSRGVGSNSEYLGNQLLPRREVVVGFTGEYNATYRGSFGIEGTATDEWAFGYTPRLEVGWNTYNDTFVSFPTDIPLFGSRIPVASLTADGDRTFTGANYVYVGNHSTENRTFNGQRATVVVPSNQTQSVDTNRVLNRLGEASRRLNVGYRDQKLNVFVPTDPIREGGFALFSPDTSIPNDLWVHADSTNSSIVFSEYVHTRQAFDTDEEMDWIVEAMDGYYSAALAREVGLEGSNFTDEVRADAREWEDTDLTDPTHNFSADYDKGARVLASVDAYIRRVTDGERTLEHVWARMNAHDSTVDYEAFTRIVERVAGQSFDPWLERSLETADLPRVPENSSLYTVEDDPIDLDGDGLSMAEERDAGTDPLETDTDDDGLGDRAELTNGTDPTVADTDRDGLDDDVERAGPTNATVADTDGDGLVDGREVDHVTNATVADTDGDGLVDGREVGHATNATVADTDGDGLSDGRELELGTNATAADTDSDGLDDGRELELGTNPAVADTDGDGLADGRELELGTNATVADTDDDGLADGRELELGTNPVVADTDGDGLSDGRELKLGTNATLADTDGDGLDDGRERSLGSDPLVPDTDGDGLYDGQEVEIGTDLTVADTDGDGVDDWTEIREQTDPTTADTDGDGVSDGTELTQTSDRPATATPSPAPSDRQTATRGDGFNFGAGLLVLVAFSVFIARCGDRDQ